MAYATGSYTSVANAGDLLYAWALTNGWTQNYSAVDGTGKRYHIEKSIGGTDFFFNFRTAINEFNVAGTFIESGIALQGSTEFTGSGTVWDEQIGFTTGDYQGSTTRGGNVDYIINTGGTYYFFATATTLTAVFETDSDESDWRMLTLGSLGGFPFYMTSGGITQDDDDRSGYATTFFISSNERNGNTALYIPTEGWYLSKPSSVGGDGLRTVGNLLSRATIDDPKVRGSVSNSIVHATPDSFRGNAQLAPSSTTITKGLADEHWPIADIEGVKFINMTNYSNRDEITYDGDVYKLFRIYNPSVPGVAFLK